MSQAEIAKEMNAMLPVNGRKYTFSDVSRFERYGCDRPVYQSYLDAGERIVQREAQQADELPHSCG